MVILTYDKHYLVNIYGLISKIQNAIVTSYLHIPKSITTKCQSPLKSLQTIIKIVSRSVHRSQPTYSIDGPIITVIISWVPKGRNGMLGGDQIGGILDTQSLCIQSLYLKNTNLNNETRVKTPVWSVARQAAALYVKIHHKIHKASYSSFLELPFQRTVCSLSLWIPRSV